MKKTVLLLTTSAMIAVCGGAAAQNISKIGQKNAWALYNYNDAQGKVCYTLSRPTDKQPPTLDHGDKMFFVVSQKPGQNVTFEPQFNASYSFQENSKVEVTVGDRKFSMFTKENRAWMENAAEEPQLIAAMRAGSDMKVAAKSRRGNPTSYVFSLSGISAALQEISACK
ncbi:MAG: invasion associated locus B family protein [Mesorhizobium sp.]|nr:invasion associated locus B family protein [Mesorhizobium sp.]